MTQLKLITTEDGSHSLYREDIRESYHSFHGALGESTHVFIKNGLEFLLEGGLNHIKVFEVGLGTGLNALLAARFAMEHQVVIDFHSVEPIPVPKEVYKQLNFGENQDEKNLLQQIHDSVWEKEIPLSPVFNLNKYQAKLEEFESDSLKSEIDAIFFDAFAPSKQAEMWGIENLKKCFSLLKIGGVLTTYCAQGQFKRDMAAAGFEVQTLKGALGKKEMVRGLKK